MIYWERDMFGHVWVIIELTLLPDGSWGLE